MSSSSVMQTRWSSCTRGSLVRRKAAVGKLIIRWNFSGESNHFWVVSAIGYSAEKLSTSTSGCEVRGLPWAVLRAGQEVLSGEGYSVATV